MTHEPMKTEDEYWIIDPDARDRRYDAVGPYQTQRQPGMNSKSEREQELSALLDLTTSALRAVQHKLETVSPKEFAAKRTQWVFEIETFLEEVRGNLRSVSPAYRPFPPLENNKP